LQHGLTTPNNQAEHGANIVVITTNPDHNPTANEMQAHSKSARATANQTQPHKETTDISSYSNKKGSEFAPYRTEFLLHQPTVIS
jgi:hypothetical protein